MDLEMAVGVKVGVVAAGLVEELVAEVVVVKAIQNMEHLPRKQRALRNRKLTSVVADK